MDTMHWFLLIGAVLVLAFLGLIGYGRYWIRRTREEMKNVDRSKLREWKDEDD